MSTTPSIAELFDSLSNTYKTGLSRPVFWRKQQLEGIKNFLTKEQSSIERALTQDLGKHPSESRLTELNYLLSHIDYTLKHLNKWVKPTRVKTPLLAWPGSSQLYPEPLGTVLILGAWNYPLQLLIAPAIAAIAAGNCVILKPSEHAPNTAEVIANKLGDYIDNHAIKVVTGDVSVANELTQQPFDHMFYTGGSNGAKAVLRNAAQHLTPTTLELGGKSPAIVSEDCDIEVTARRLVWGKYLNAGQTCIAPDYVLVQDSIRDTLISKIKEQIELFYGNDPQQSDDYGRIISANHWQRLIKLLDDTDIISGGDYQRKDNYIAPTLINLDGLDSEHPLHHEEIFGPLLPIKSVTSIQAAIDYVIAKPKPLACYAFSKNNRTLEQVKHQVSAGSYCANDTLMFMLNEALPFGGVGQSGMGRYHGKFGFDTLSHQKAVMKRSFKFDVALRYPPYTKLKDKLLAWLK